LKNQADKAKKIEIITAELGRFTLSPDQLKKSAHALYDFYSFLDEYNRKVNLVADSSFEEFLYRHVLDSLSVIELIKSRNIRRIIDIGSGAGLPGIPICILCSDVRLLSVESIRKKTTFQEELLKRLHLDGVTAVNMRAEALAASDIRESADMVVTRAVADSSVLAEIALPFLKIGGIAVFYKGTNISTELSTAKKAISVCGGKLTSINTYKIREIDPERSLVIIEKVKPTPKKYPREVGVAFKNPIL